MMSDVRGNHGFSGFFNSKIVKMTGNTSLCEEVAKTDWRKEANTHFSTLCLSNRLIINRKCSV